MLCISTLFIGAGLIHSMIVKDFSWFQRIGSIIVGIGILLLARSSLINQALLIQVKMADSPFYSNDPEHYKYIGEEVPKHIIEDVQSRTAINKYGPIITLIGTFIWGYGDLLNRVFF